MDTPDLDALWVEGLRKTFDATDDEQIPSARSAASTSRWRTAPSWPSWARPGCGKSTLLNLVAGLETPTDGRIAIDGEAIDGRSDDELAVTRRRHIGLVFQFFNLLEGMSVLENVSLPMVVAGRAASRPNSRAMDLLDLLGIADKARRSPGVLSGGQRQRLSIARALANEPTLLLADEPTGSLDSEGGAEVLGLFRRLHEGGQTIVMVTHDDEVAASAQRIVRMRDGRVDDGQASAPGAAGGVFGVLEEPRAVSAPGMRARADVRARPISLIAVTILVGVIGAIAIAAFAGRARPIRRTNATEQRATSPRPSC